MVRNPNFDASLFGGNVPAGNPDKMTVQIFGDASVALTRTLNGQDDYDFYQPPNDRLGRARVEVRQPDQGVHAGEHVLLLHEHAHRAVQQPEGAAGGQLRDRPPGARAHLRRPRDADAEHPAADVSAVQEAQPLPVQPGEGEAADQRRPGRQGAAVTIWGSNNESRRSPEATAYLQQVLNSIGLKAKLKIINAAVYWTTIGNQATKAQIGFADWFQDYPHPLDWFDVLLNGERITQTHNNNYADFNDAAVNAKIDALKKQPALTSVGQRPVGRARQADHAAGSMGAVHQPAGDRHLQLGHRSELLRVPRQLPVRLRDDLPQVDRSRDASMSGAPLTAPPTTFDRVRR